jgi:hypothetical protein
MKLVNVKRTFSRICLAIALIALLGSPIVSTAEARTLKPPRVEAGAHGGWFDQIVSRLMELLPGRQRETSTHEKGLDLTLLPRGGSGIISYSTNNGSCIDPQGRPTPCGN